MQGSASGRPWSPSSRISQTQRKKERGDESGEERRDARGEERRDARGDERRDARGGERRDASGDGRRDARRVEAGDDSGKERNDERRERTERKVVLISGSVVYLSYTSLFYVGWRQVFFRRKFRKASIGLIFSIFI